jgi:hypothetical protein
MRSDSKGPPLLQQAIAARVRQRGGTVIVTACPADFTRRGGGLATADRRGEHELVIAAATAVG